MTVTPSSAMPAPAPVPGQVTSKSAVGSFVLGILFCLPLGIITIILAIVGFVKTGNPNVKGRWMAVVGGILGVMNVAGWSIFMVAGGIVALMAWFVAAPALATRDFIKAMSTGDETAVHAMLAPGFDEDALVTVEKFVRDQGAFDGATYTTANVDNDTAHVEGTASFAKSSKGFKVDLLEKDKKWLIKEIEFDR
jgi:hypothetical protein